MEAEPLLNCAIELHDTELSSIKERRRTVVVSFSGAYLHKSTGKPGWDAGSGWVQAAELVFKDAALPIVSADLPEDVSQGDLTIGTETLHNVIPLPLDYVGPVKLVIRLSGYPQPIYIRGGGVRLKLLGEPTYVEEFPGAG